MTGIFEVNWNLFMAGHIEEEINIVAQVTNTVFKDFQIWVLQFGGKGINLALWWQLELLLLWHHETCHGLSSHFQTQEGESWASSWRIIFLFQTGFVSDGGKKGYLFIKACMLMEEHYWKTSKLMKSVYRLGKF